MALVAALVTAMHYGVGDERPYVGSFAVTGEVIVRLGWLAENGALVLISKYPKLFAEIGHAYNPAGPGVDPGGGQFYLPDRTDGRTFIPRGATNFPTRGTKGGAKVVALASDGSQDAFHTHTYTNRDGSITPDAGVGAKIGAEPGPGLGGHKTPTSGAPTGRAGGAAATHQNMPPIRVIGGWIIRYA